MSFLIALLATSIWLPPQYYINESTLIAIVNIGQVHEAKTPEMVLVRSAQATVEKVLYYEFKKESKPPNEIIIYQIVPNGQFETDNDYDYHGYTKLTPGRRFVILKQQGVNKFFPYTTLSLQEITKAGIFWPTTNMVTDRFTEEQIIEKINNLLKK